MSRPDCAEHSGSYKRKSRCEEKGGQGGSVGGRVIDRASVSASSTVVVGGGSVFGKSEDSGRESCGEDSADGAGCIAAGSRSSRSVRLVSTRVRRLAIVVSLAVGKRASRGASCCLGRDRPHHHHYYHYYCHCLLLLLLLRLLCDGPTWRRPMLLKKNGGCVR